MPGRLLISCLVLGALAGHSVSARAADHQLLLFQVAVPASLELTGLRAEVDRLGVQTALPLMDDGSTPGDIPGDGVYVGELVGDYSRTITMMLVAEQDDGERVVFNGVLRTEDALLATLGFRLLATPEGPVSVRVPMPYSGTGSETYESLQLVSAFGWGMLVLAYVAFLVADRGRRRRRPRKPAAP